MRVGWIHDKRKFGGAYITNQIWLKHKPDSVDIIYMYPDDELIDCDLYIIHTLNDCDLFTIRQLLDKKYIYCSHECYALGIERLLVANAHKCIWLSPLHRRNRPGVCVPPPISDEFQEHKGEGYLYLGRYTNFKGLDTVAAWAREHNVIVDCYGYGDYKPFGSHIRDKGAISYDNVPALLARYNALVFMPDIQEAFGRVVAEAKLSGCELICNAKVGALSYEWQDWRKELSQSCALFWSAVMEG